MGAEGWVGFGLFLELEPPWLADELDAVWERSERSQGQFRSFCLEQQGHPPIIEEGNTVGGARFCGGGDKELKVTHVNLEVPGSWVVQAETEWAAWRYAFRFKGKVWAGGRNVGVVSISMAFKSVQLNEIS